MKQYSLSAQHIQKKYNGSPVLNDVSIKVEKGAIYGLIGKNGSGKTTLLRVLTGLIPVYEGKVALEKLDNRVPRVGAVIDSPSLFLNMTAMENLKAHSLLLGIRENTPLEEVLKTVDLSSTQSKRVKDFSLGMVQRLKLAMALLTDPDILILDEPLNGLDPDGIKELRELLLRLNRDKAMTILISSHLLSELEQVASCFGILHDGAIVKEFTAEDVCQRGHLEDLYLEYTQRRN